MWQEKKDKPSRFHLRVAREVSQNEGGGEAQGFRDGALLLVGELLGDVEHAVASYRVVGGRVGEDRRQAGARLKKAV